MTPEAMTAAAAFAVLAELRWSVAQLHKRVGTLETTKADKPMKLRARAAAPLLFLLAALCLCFGGCTGDQVARAEVAVANAERVAGEAKGALQVAQEAVQVAQAAAQAAHAAQSAAAEAAAKRNDDAARAAAEAAAARAAEADRALARVQGVMDRAAAVVSVVEASATQARVAFDAARQAQAAGGGTLDTIIAVGVALLTGGGGAYALGRRGVAGLSAALDVLADHGRRLAAAPDDQAVAMETANTLRAAQSAGVAHLVLPKV